MSKEYTYKCASISTCRQYRYSLWRRWGGDFEDKFVLFLGLNPSTADGDVDDATIRKCVEFADQWGFKKLCMANLFAFRATQPTDMKKALDPVGPMNDAQLKTLLEDAALVVCAWGNDGKHLQRDDKVTAILQSRASVVKCFQLNSNGTPKHPLYVAYGTPLIPFLKDPTDWM